MTVGMLEALMIEHSIPAGKMFRAPEMLEDPHYASREAIIEVDTPKWGPLKMQNAFPILSDTPSRVRSPAPSEIGQDNESVYGELLGMDKVKMAELKSAGVI
jgi:crotonobetainyl-CoA:carnitine CoA-transferase CaiB-like acyl-CoA transferase